MNAQVNQVQNSTTDDIPPEVAAMNELNEIFAGDDPDSMVSNAASPSAEPEPESLPAPEPEVKPVEPSAPAAPTPTTQAAEPPAASPAAPATPPAAVTPEPPAAPAATSAPTPEDVAKQMENLSKLYTITEEEALLYQTEPEKALPAMAARLHANLVMHLGQLLPQVVPQITEAQQQAVQLENRAKEVFFNAWPTLKDHEADVLRVGKVYRAANPQATAEQAVKEIGEIVSRALNITPPAPTAAPAAVPAAPAAPTTPAFRPANVGGSRGAAPKPSEWDDLVKDD